jgi:D-glycero-alpha-D-manno-heptose-7-phosphate kinase
VLITRTPLRIALGGGGTDLPSFYRRAGGGFVISAAIQKYVYIALNPTFTGDYFVKYSELERTGSIDRIRHGIIRTALQLHPVPPGIEIASVADIPSGTGLGSSGSFTVGLLKALHAHTRNRISDHDLAEEACALEIDHLGRPVGKQDQYIAVFGGLTCFDLHADDTVGVSSLAVPPETLRDLSENLLMFFTGYSRDAASVLSDQRRRSEQDDRAMIENLSFVRDTGYEIRKRLEDGDTEGFAELLHEHWVRKRERSDGMTNPAIDRWYERARANGALGGKLVGAGGGGFLLFYASDPPRLRATMASEGLAEVRFGFDLDGSTVLVRG